MVFRRNLDPATSRTPPPPPATASPTLPPATTVVSYPMAEPTPVSPARSVSMAETASESVIGSDLTIEGQGITIRCLGTLRINGTVQASIESQKLIVGEEAKVSGAIAADIVDVLGGVNGTIQASNVNLHRSARVDGDIVSRNLTIAEGASFDGRCRRLTDTTPAVNAPATGTG